MELGPLSLPDAGETRLEEIARSEAVRLFVAADAGGAGQLRADGRGGAARGGHRPRAGRDGPGHRAGGGAHGRAGRGPAARAAVAALRAAAQRAAGCLGAAGHAARCDRLVLEPAGAEPSGRRWRSARCSAAASRWRRRRRWWRCRPGRGTCWRCSSRCGPLAAARGGDGGPGDEAALGMYESIRQYAADRLHGAGRRGGWWRGTADGTSALAPGLRQQVRGVGGTETLRQLALGAREPAGRL